MRPASGDLVPPSYVLPLIVGVMIAAVALTLYCLSHGISTVFMHLYYLPIVLIAYFYRRRGIPVLIGLSLLYLILSTSFLYPSKIEIESSVLRAGMFILIGVIVAELAEQLERKKDAHRLAAEDQKSIIDNANVWLTILDSHGRVLVWNRAAASISGYRPDEVLGQNGIWKVLYPDREYRAKITTTIARIINEKNYLENFETEIRTKDGRTRTISWNTRGLMGDKGTGTRYVAIGLDISERKRAEEALRDSERRYRTILEQAADAIFIHDINGSILDVNQEACQSLGYSREELLSLSVRDIDPEAIQTEKDKLWSAVIAGKHFTFESHQRRRDGSTFPVEVSLSSVHLPEGLVIIGNVRDITERKRTDDVLRASEDRFRNIFTQAAEGILIADISTQKFLYANPAICEMLGYSGGELTSMGVRDIHPKQDLAHVEEVFRALARGGEKAFVENIPVLRKDGAVRYMDIRSSTIIIDGQTCNLGMFTDITDRKRAEEIIALTSRKLSLMNEVTYQFIQNKITALYGFTELSKDVKTDAERLVFIKKEEHILEDINNLIKNSKDYQELGLTQLRWMPVEPSIRMAVSLVSPQPGISIQIALDRLEVYADPLIEKIFYKLIDNAEKHGKTLTRITFTCHEKDDGLLLTCEDNGVGIAPERKARLFERDVGEKSGFDLFFIRECLAFYGMSIAETGEPGKGARFEISVPNGGYRFTTPGTSDERTI